MSAPAAHEIERPGSSDLRACRTCGATGPALSEAFDDLDRRCTACGARPADPPPPLPTSWAWGVRDAPAGSAPWLGEQPHRYCARCGAGLAPDGAYCQRCGRLQPVEIAPVWRETPSPALVGALVGATGGLYAYYWAFDTWRQLKREDPHTHGTKYPIWHALALLIPVYGLLRLHAHFVEVRDLAAPRWFRPRLGVLAWMVALSLWRVSDHSGVSVWVGIASVAIQAAVLAWAQAALNAGWRARPGGAAPGRFGLGSWALLILGALLTIWTLMGGIDGDEHSSLRTTWL